MYVFLAVTLLFFSSPFSSLFPEKSHCEARQATTTLAPCSFIRTCNAIDLNLRSLPIPDPYPVAAKLTPQLQGDSSPVHSALPTRACTPDLNLLEQRRRYHPDDDLRPLNVHEKGNVLFFGGGVGPGVEHHVLLLEEVAAAGDDGVCFLLFDVVAWDGMGWRSE